jgi:ribosome maturation factor RimP
VDEVESRIESLAAPIAASLGCEVVETRHRRGNRTAFVSIFLDAARPEPTAEELAAAARPFDPAAEAPPAPYEGSPVSVDTCAAVSEQLGAVLDAEGLIAGRYVLEVSSPGLERPLKRRKDYVRFRGQQIDVRVAEAGGGSRKFRGTLAAVRGDGITVMPGDAGPVGGPGGTEVPFSRVLSARLVYRDPAKPKPGGRRPGDRGVR